MSPSNLILSDLVILYHPVTTTLSGSSKLASATKPHKSYAPRDIAFTYPPNAYFFSKDCFLTEDLKSLVHIFLLFIKVEI